MAEMMELERRAMNLEKIYPILIKDQDENYLSNIAVWRGNILKKAVPGQWKIRQLYQGSRLSRRDLDRSPSDQVYRGVTSKKHWGIEHTHSSKGDGSGLTSEHWDKGYLQVCGFNARRKEFLLSDVNRDRIYLKYLLEDEGTRLMFLRNVKEEDTKTMGHYSRIWLEALLAKFLAESKRIRTYIVMALNYLESQCLTHDKLDFWHSLQRLVSTHYSDTSGRKLTDELQKELVYFLKRLKVLNKHVERKRHRKVIAMGNYLLSKLKRKNMKEFRRMKLCIICDLLDSVGGAYLTTQMYSEALDYFAEELNLGKKQHLPNGIFRSLDNIGLLFACKGEYENAVSVWTKRLPSLETDIEKTWLNQAVAQCYAYLTLHHKSLEYAKNSLSYAKKCKSVPWEICAQLLMAHNYCRLETTSEMAAKQNLYAALDCLYNAFIGAACSGDNKVRGMVTALFIQVEDRLMTSPGSFPKAVESRNQRCLTSMSRHLASVLENDNGHNANASNSIDEKGRRGRREKVRKQALSGLQSLVDGTPPPVLSPSLNSSNHIRESTRRCIAPLLSDSADASRDHSPWPVSTSAPAPWLPDEDRRAAGRRRKRPPKASVTSSDLRRDAEATSASVSLTDTEVSPAPGESPSGSSTVTDPRGDLKAGTKACRSRTASQLHPSTRRDVKAKPSAGKGPPVSLTSSEPRRDAKPTVGKSPKLSRKPHDPRRDLKTKPTASRSSQPSSDTKVKTGTAPSLSSTLSAPRWDAKDLSLKPRRKAKPTTSDSPSASQPSSDGRRNKDSSTEEWISLPSLTCRRGKARGDSEVKTSRGVQSVKHRGTKRQGRRRPACVGRRRRNLGVPWKVHKVKSRRKTEEDDEERRERPCLDFWPSDSLDSASRSALLRLAMKGHDARSAVERYHEEEDSPVQSFASTDVPIPDTARESTAMPREPAEVSRHREPSAVHEGATDSDVTWEDISDDEENSLSFSSSSRDEEVQEAGEDITADED